MKERPRQKHLQLREVECGGNGPCSQTVSLRLLLTSQFCTDAWSIGQNRIAIISHLLRAYEIYNQDAVHSLTSPRILGYLYEKALVLN
jgi:hypothetical protein